MSKETVVNPVRKYSREEFVQAIVDTANNSRSKRGNLNSVNITGSVEDLGGSTEDKRYRFVASFGEIYVHQDSTIKYGLCSFVDFGCYQEKFDEMEVVRDNLALIQKRIGLLNNRMKSRIEGKVLAVDSVPVETKATLDKKSPFAAMRESIY